MQNSIIHFCSEKMNKSHLALIGVVIASIIIVVTVVFAQLLIQNNDRALSTTSPSSSLTPSATQFQPFTQDEIATLRADSLELQIKDTMGSISFNRKYNTTSDVQFLSTYAGNFTNISKTAFLESINSYSLSSPYFDNNIIRIGNTFYFFRREIHSLFNQNLSTFLSCTP
jgi:hypothetical protein